MNFGKPQQTRSRSIKAFGIWECVSIWFQISIIQLFHSLTDVIDFLPKCEEPWWIWVIQLRIVFPLFFKLRSWISTHNEFWQTTTIKITVNQGVWHLGICGHLMPSIPHMTFPQCDFCRWFLTKLWGLWKTKRWQDNYDLCVGTGAEKQPLHLEQTIALHWKGGNKRRRRWRSKTSAEEEEV